MERSLISRLMGVFRGAQPAADMTGRDLDAKLVKALREVEPTLDWVVTTAPVKDPNRVVYQVYVPGEAPSYVSEYVMYERAFTLADNGVVSLGDARVEVEAVTYYEPVLMNEDVTDAAGKRNSAKDQEKIQAMHDHAVALGGACAPTAASAVEEIVAASAATADTLTNQETEDMELKDIVAFLGTATECDKKALRSALGVETPEPVVAAAPAKTPTFAELLATADPATRAAIESGVRAAAATKAASIKALKDSGRCAFSDETLEAMDQASLDNMTALAQIAPATDFSVSGAPKVPTVPTTVAPPADLRAAILAARGGK